MPASDKREAGLCATPDNSVNTQTSFRMQKPVFVFGKFCRPHNSSFAGAREADLVIVAEGRRAPGKYSVSRFRQREGGCHA
jgi:hypothetical protein